MEKKTLWQFPWGYKESIIFLASVIVIGYLIQIETGVFNFRLLAYPVNLIVAAALILFLVACTCIRNNPVVTWLCSIPLANTLLLAFLLLGIIMGLTPQSDRWEFGNIFSTIGFTRMTSSWPFVLVYLILLVSLGLVTMKRLFSKPLSLMFICNHLGLWLLLLIAGLGYADIHRYIMQVSIGEMQWRGYNAYDTLEELPLAIRLNEFSMEVYPPKLAVIDRQSGEPQPVGRPDLFQIASGVDQAQLAGWQVQVETFLPRAARHTNDTYVAWPMLGSAPAAFVTARHLFTGEEKQGWISSGNSSQAFMVLNLDEQYALAMALPEPKRFVSDITVMTTGSTREPARALLAVNEPFVIDHWYIYQYAYDREARELSPYSNFELVYDPWVNWIYASFGLMVLGSVGMIWAGRKKDRKK